MLSEQDWRKVYEERGALWIHDGNPIRPHALLTSGNHSSGFFNSELVMEDPTLLDEATADLVELLIEADLNISLVNRVVGPAMGAVNLVGDLARNITRHRYKEDPRCLRAYVEKEEGGMAFKKTGIRPGEVVLLGEDVITTGGSVEATARAVAAREGQVLPFVATLVNRSGQAYADGRMIVALITEPMPIWQPEECPLCTKGSQAIRPKGENWARLNAEYPSALEVLHE